MKYLGNCKEWVNPEWLPRIENSYGDVARISDIITSDTVSSDTYNKFLNFKYPDIGAFISFFTKDQTADIKDFSITVPSLIDTTDKDVTCRFIKIIPGQVLPLHSIVSSNKNTRYYWITLKEYIPGHILTWEGGNLLSKYEVGDVYELDRENIKHGIANIGYQSNIAFECIVQDKDIGE